MRKILTLVFLFFFFNVSFSQQNPFTFVYKIQNDSLFIKWFPTESVILHQLLNNEVNVSWKKIKDFSDTLSNANKTSVVNKSNLTNADKDSKEYAYLEPFIKYSTVFDSSKIQPLFGYALIENAQNKKASALLNNQLVIPKIKPSDRVFFEITVNKTTYKSSVVIDCKEIQKPSTVSFHEFDLKKKKELFIEWDPELYNEFITYNIYKSLDEKNFTRLNENPMIFSKNKDIKAKQYSSILDKKLEKGKTYYYQIKARDFFGEETGKSEIKKVYIPITVDAYVQIDTIQAKQRDRLIDVSIMASDSVSKPSISRLVLLQSDSVLTGYKELLSFKVDKAIATHQFKLTNYLTGDNFYYKVAAISKDNDSVISVPYLFFTLDQEPPEIVTQFKGNVDSLGIVKLSWIAPKDKDIKGYRLFRANTKKEEFIELTTDLKTETHFTDTLALNTLTNDIYYFVRVVDNNYNNSKNSDTLLLVKPDTIAPIVAVFKDYSSAKEGITLKWANSTSEDLKSQYLLRKNGNVMDTIFRWKDKISMYLDTNVSSGQSYDYQLLSIDKSKNVTKSASLNVNFELGFRDAIKQFDGEVNRTNKSIILKWDYPIKKDVYSYQIYKCRADGKFFLYKTLFVTQDFQTTFEDKDLKINTVYKYQIKAILKSGLSTVMSKEVLVTY